MPDDPPDAARQVRELLTHLGALRATDLSRLQRARLDLAFVAAHALARALGVPEDEGPPLRVPTAIGSRPPRALVVDDNSINLHVAVSMLRAAGVEAEAASSGAEALDRMGAYPFDLVLLDVMMPGDDGIEVARQIRERFGAAPCVVGLTGMPGLADVATEAGMDAVFAKPLRREQVAEAVRLCLDR